MYCHPVGVIPNCCEYIVASHVSSPTPTRLLSSRHSPSTRELRFFQASRIETSFFAVALALSLVPAASVPEAAADDAAPSPGSSGAAGTSLTNMSVATTSKTASRKYIHRKSRATTNGEKIPYTRMVPIPAVKTTLACTLPR